MGASSLTLAAASCRSSGQTWPRHGHWFCRRIHGELEIPAAVIIRTLFGDILRSTPNSPRPTPTRTKAAGATLLPLAGVTSRSSGPTWPGWPHRAQEEHLASSPSYGREQGVHRGARCVLDVGWTGYERSSRSAGGGRAALHHPWQQDTVEFTRSCGHASRRSSSTRWQIGSSCQPATRLSHSLSWRVETCAYCVRMRNSMATGHGR
jgi:hypothetical protein